jgi:hypothetical protein
MESFLMMQIFDASNFFISEKKLEGIDLRQVDMILVIYEPDRNAGPSGFEPETAGFLSCVKSPVLYLAELRAHLTVRLCRAII